MGDYVKKHGTENKCSYCSRSGENIAIAIGDLKNCILRAWNILFDDADDFDFNQQSEDIILKSKDLIFKDPYTKITDANINFLHDLEEYLIHYIWIPKTGCFMNNSGILLYSWRNFSDLVKKERRYTFFQNDGIEYLSLAKSPLDTLQEISRLLNSQTSLIKTIPAQTVFFRGRLFDKQKKAKAAMATQLGTASVKNSRNNRFSPAGIPMFYGCMKKDAVIKELRPAANKYLVIGEFYNTKPLKILDLTEIPPVPLYTGSEIEVLSLHFLHCFAAEISKPTHNESLDYIPTQVFTEYIRYIGLRNGSIKGIKYNSAEAPDQSNVVLFYKKKDCKDKDSLGEDCLILKDKEVCEV